jgi:hypothetical protein
MLAKSDKDGYVWASLSGLAHAARVTDEQCRAAIDKFMSPDTDSRSDDYDGRRIEKVDRGWLLLNKARFRDMRDEDEHRRKERERKRAQRAKEKVERDAAKVEPTANDFDGSPDETICPADLYEQSERIHPELVRVLKGATLEGVQASANRFAAHYIIGPGMGQKRRFWMRELRRWVTRDHGEGTLDRKRKPKNDHDARAARIARLTEEEKVKAAE